MRQDVLRRNAGRIGLCRTAILLSLIHIFRDVQPEDIEDISERFLPMWQEGRDSDSVKKVRLKDCELFLIAIVEHQSKVHYDMAFKMCIRDSCEVNPIPVKAAMNMLGWEAGPLRMPLTEMEPEHKEKLKKAMIDFGIEVK